MRRQGRRGTPQVRLIEPRFGVRAIKDGGGVVETLISRRGMLHLTCRPPTVEARDVAVAADHSPLVMWSSGADSSLSPPWVKRPAFGGVSPSGLTRG